MRFGKKLHYFFKYLVIGFPVLILLLSALSQAHFVTVVSDLYDMTNEMVNLFPSNWYINLLDLLDIQYLDFSNIASIFTFYPLYIFYVYLFDLILDVMTFIPKFFHDLLNKDYLK